MPVPAPAGRKSIASSGAMAVVGVLPPENSTPPGVTTVLPLTTTGESPLIRSDPTVPTAMINRGGGRETGWEDEDRGFGRPVVRAAAGGIAARAVLGHRRA